MARRTLPRVLRIGLWSLVGLLVLVVAGGAVIALSFDPDSLKPRIVAAVKQATGRDLTLDGRIRLGLSLRPTLTVQGVSFANPPGFSRPQMATLERLDLKLALLPAAEPPRRDRPAGAGEAGYHPRDGCTGPAELAVHATDRSGSAAINHRGHARDRAATRVSVADVRIENGTLTWRDGRAGRSDSVRSHQSARQRRIARCRLQSCDVGDLQRRTVHSGRRFRAVDLAGERAPSSPGRCRPNWRPPARSSRWTALSRSRCWAVAIGGS